MTNLILFNNRKEVEVKTISSIEVAKMTDKRHDHLIRDISNIIKRIEKEERNVNNFFVQSIYKDKNNQERKKYDITKEGIDLILINKKGKTQQCLINIIEREFQSKPLVEAVYPEREENLFFYSLEKRLVLEGYSLQTQFKIENLNYKIDGYVKEVNLCIEYDEEHHKHQKDKDSNRQKEIVNTLNCNFIRVDSKNSNEENIKFVLKKIREFNKSDKVKLVLESKATSEELKILNGIESIYNNLCDKVDSIKNNIKVFATEEEQEKINFYSLEYKKQIESYNSIINFIFSEERGI